MARFPYNPFNMNSGFGRNFIEHYNETLKLMGMDSGEQKARVDNLIRNTPQPSETVDIRLDDEGIEHSTARERISSDYKKTLNHINNVSSDVDSIFNQPTKYDILPNLGDQSAKIQAALQDSQSFKFPFGKYRIDNKVKVTTPTVLIGDNGETSIDIMSNQQADGTRLLFEGVDGIIIRDIKFSEINSVLKRSNLYGTLAFEGCKNIILDNVEIDGANGVAMHFINCENIIIINPRILNTKADGMHFQRGCRNVKIFYPYFQYTEDDCIGFVSHGYEEYGQCDGLEVWGGIYRDVIGTGSGICGDGSKNIKINGVDIKNTPLASIRINPLQDSGSTRYVYPSNFEVTNATLDSSGLSTAVGQKSAITAYRTNNVKIKDITMRNCKGGIYALECEGLIDISSLQSQSCGERLIWVSTKTIQNVLAIIKLSDVLSKKNDTDAIYIEGIAFKPELIVISNCDMTDINPNNKSNIYGIFIDTAKHVHIKNNTIYSKEGSQITKIMTKNCDVVTRLNNFPFDVNEVMYIGDTKHSMGEGPPTTGYHKAGEVVWNWNPSSADNVSYWECRLSGTPGVWGNVKFSEGLG
ncbi:hypothetical protein [Priestia flexa]|uniref:hypothetical protein n=1 Tax=Priestia flexa TaxID=86664 RepID=UPI0013D6CD44|nr:hypothetical protein [Priestia flexa]